MSTQETKRVVAMDATDRLGIERIGKLLWDFSIPAIVGMLVNAIYNIVDRIYVGQGVDSLGIAGITLVMPLMILIIASSVLVGIGANSLFSIRLGEGRRDEVEKIMGHAFALLFLIPGAVILLLFIFIDPILKNILNASDTVFPYAKTYFKIILYGGIFSAMGPGISHFIRSDGHPRTAMLTQLIGAISNIILDPVFIFGFGWGIAGAAWATILSQFLSFCWVMYYFNSPMTKLRFRLKEMKLKWDITANILAIGFAPFIMQLAIGLVNVFLNRSLFVYGGDTGVAAMGIVYSILVIFFMPLHGLNQGVQPIIGYNYGAKQYGRVKEAYRLATLSGTVFVCAGFALVQLFPSVCIALFRNEEGPLMDMGIRALRLSTICLPFLGLQVISASFFQAIGKALQGTILSLSRQILLYIPILFILPRFLGIDGVFFAMPSADLGAAILSALIIRAEFKKLKS